MAKIKVNNLPEGFEIKNGKVVKKMQQGGLTTGDQSDYGLVTNPFLRGESDASADSVRYSLSSVPRDIANLEAEGGETVLTDLNDDGQFGLYDIKGPRHSSGGVPMYLPEQSFVFSDTQKMKLGKEVLSEFGISSKKKMTPAAVSKKFDLNKYHGVRNNPNTDSIGLKSAELMISKNGGQLSKLSFAQEAEKQFSDGVPVTAHPYLISQGIDPIQFTQQMEEISREQAMQKAMSALSPEQLQQMLMMQEMLQQAGQMPQQGGQQIMPEEEMQMAKYGAELEKYTNGGGPKRNTAIDLGKAKTYDDLFNIIINQKGIAENMYRDVQGAKEKGYYGDALANAPAFLENWKGIYPDLESLKNAIESQRKGTKSPEVEKFQRWVNETYIPGVVEDIKQKSIAAGKTWTDDQTKSYTASLTKDYGFDPTQKGKGYDGKYGTNTSSRVPISFEIKPDEVTITPTEPDPTEPDPTEPGEYTPPGPEPEIPFYIQDQLAMANTAMLDGRLGQPFVRNVGTNLGVRLQGPEFEVASLLSKARQADEANLAYSGPQAGSARNALTAGQAMQAIAGTANQIQANNVNSVNRFLQQDAHINLKTDRYNAAADERGDDKQEAALENYNNWQNARNTLFNKQLQNAYTNRALARNLSAAFPNMSIGTGSGGDIYKSYDTPITPTKSQTSEQARGAREESLRRVNELYPNAKNPMEIVNWLNSGVTTQSNSMSPAERNAEQVRAMINAGARGPVASAKKGKEIKAYATPFYSGTMGNF